MFNDDHCDSSRRHPWMPLLALVAGVVLILAAALPQGAPVGSTSAQAAAPSQPAVPPPGFEPFPPRPELSDTLAATLEAYARAPAGEQPLAVDQAQAENVTLTACAAFSPRVRVPFVRSNRSGSAPVNRADVAITLWPTPSIFVARDATLSYELRIRNYGRAATSRASVTLPYVKQQMTVIGSQFSTSGDWVSEVTDNHVTVTLAPIVASTERTAKLLFRVNGTLPNNTVINMRATYRWEDARGSGEWRTNWAPVLVGNGNESAPWAWMEVNPMSGSSGTRFHVYTDRFIPQEGVIVWLNTPSGTRPTALRAIADQYGRACVDFASRGLPPGTYSLVLYGARSQLIAIARFYVL